MDPSTLHNELHTVWFQKTWGRIRIVLGIIFSVIFILGAIILKDYSYLAYLLLSAGLIFMGYQRLKTPYLEYNQQIILIRNGWGSVLNRYEIRANAQFSVSKNRLYLNGHKIRANSWFTNSHDWERFIRFFTDGSDHLENLVD